MHDFYQAPDANPPPGELGPAHVPARGSEAPATTDRRGFVKQACTVAIGGVALSAPIVAGLAVYLDPLMTKRADASFVRVTSLDALADDGTPQRFTIFANKRDAWTTFPQAPIGAVFIAKHTADDRLCVYNVICPHAGCHVEHSEERNGYYCPCHNSRFNHDGSVNPDETMSPRGLDELEYEIRDEVEVWVKFMNFRIGEKEKIPA